MELLKLQKEIRELRQQNYELQNILLNNTSKNPNKFKQNNNIQKYFTANKEIQKKNKFDQKNKISYGKLPLHRGMFSYKTTLNNNFMNYNNNYHNYNYNYNNDMYRNSSQKTMKINIQNYHNNNINSNSLLSAELKLNLDDNINPDNSMTVKMGMGNRVMSASSLDLNKYKINKNNIINQKKNIIMPNFQKINYSNKALNISDNDYQNNNNDKSYSDNQMLNNNQNINENINNLEMNVEIKKKNVRRIADHFRNNPKNEQESRRMIIELIKILNKQRYKNKKNYNSDDIENTLEKNNISKKVLNKEYNLEEFSSWNVFNNSNIFANSKDKDINNNNFNSKKNLLNNNSIEDISISNSKDINNNVKKPKLKNLFTPITTNINNFLRKMNDVKKDKINIISFLSIPRIMNLYYLNQKYTFIFILSPNEISYKEGIESYIFKFADINSQQFVGGFDLIKVKICSKIQNKPNNFYIETFNGKIKRNYEIEANSSYIADNYVKYINYLSQLVKCKIYDFKSVYKE